MLTPHLDVFRLAMFQKELANDAVSQRPLRHLPHICKQREKTMDEVLEQVRQSAKELAEKSPRLSDNPTPIVDFEQVSSELSELLTEAIKDYFAGKTTPLP